MHSECIWGENASNFDTEPGNISFLYLYSIVSLYQLSVCLSVCYVEDVVPSGNAAATGGEGSLMSNADLGETIRGDPLSYSSIDLSRDFSTDHANNSVIITTSSASSQSNTSVFDGTTAASVSNGTVTAISSGMAGSSVNNVAAQDENRPMTMMSYAMPPGGGSIRSSSSMPPNAVFHVEQPFISKPFAAQSLQSNSMPGLTYGSSDSKPSSSSNSTSNSTGSMQPPAAGFRLNVQQPSSGLLSMHQFSSGLPSMHQSSSGLPSMQESSSGLLSMHQSSSGLPSMHQSSSGLPSMHQSSSGLPSMQESSSGLPSMQESSSGLPLPSSAETGLECSSTSVHVGGSLESWDDLNDSHWDNTADTDALITATAVAMESINDTARPGPLSSNNQPIDAVSSSSSIEETTFQKTSTTMDYSAANASSICMPSVTADVSSSSVIIASAALEESRLALLTTNHCENVLNKRLEVFIHSFIH